MRSMPEIATKVEESTVGKRTFVRRLFRIEYFLLVINFAFIALALLARNYPYFSFDLTITRFIQSITIPGFKSLMLLLSKLGDMPIAAISVLVFALVLMLVRKQIAGGFVLLSSFGVSSLAELLKYLVARPRPSASLINQIGVFVKNDSFPSGHVLFFIGLYGFLYIFIFSQFKERKTRTAALAILIALLVGIGLSRIYVGAHWFSDVMGSYLIGSFWLYLMTYLYKKFEKKSS